MTLFLARCFALYECADNARVVEHISYMSDDYDNTDISAALLGTIQKLNGIQPQT